MAAMMLATFFAAEPVRGEQVLAEKQAEAPLWTPRGLFDAIVGPFIAFFRSFGPSAVMILLAISLFQLPNFVSGPMYNPMYVDLGLTKDMVGGGARQLRAGRRVPWRGRGRIFVPAAWV